MPKTNSGSDTRARGRRLRRLLGLLGHVRGLSLLAGLLVSSLLFFGSFGHVAAAGPSAPAMDVWFSPSPVVGHPYRIVDVYVSFPGAIPNDYDLTLTTGNAIPRGGPLFGFDNGTGGLSPTTLARVPAGTMVMVVPGMVMNAVTEPQLVPVDAHAVDVTDPSVVYDTSTFLLVDPPQLANLAPVADQVVGGSPVSLTVQLAQPAPSDGQKVVVTLARTSGDPVDPAADCTQYRLVIPPGETEGVLGIKTFPRDAPQDFVASTSGFNAIFTVLPASPAGLKGLPLEVKGGNAFFAYVALDGPAGPSGKVVTMSYGALVSGPATVTIPPRATQATVKFNTVPVDLMCPMQIVAGGVSGEFTLLHPVVSTINIAGSVPHYTTYGTISLDGKAPAGGFPITMSTSHGTITNVSVAAGSKNSGKFSLKIPSSVPHGTVVTITATHGADVKTTTVTVF